MLGGQWSQWAVNYAKDALGGSTLGLLVKFSGVLQRQLVCTSAPLPITDCSLHRVQYCACRGSTSCCVFGDSQMSSMSICTAPDSACHHHGIPFGMDPVGPSGSCTTIGQFAPVRAAGTCLLVHAWPSVLWRCVYMCMLT